MTTMTTMTKPIKLTGNNGNAIFHALRATNGTASTHTYNLAGEIGAEAESRLFDMGIPKAERDGAQWIETSGGKVSNAYTKKGHASIRTSVTLERRKAGWFLVSIAKVALHKEGGGPGRLFITQAQLSIARRSPQQPRI